MAQVPDKVLAWLHSVLHEYHDSTRTYTDSARVLSFFPTLSPRTEIYTYEDGTSALLLSLSGTLPVEFRGRTYRYPLKIWVPHAYPQQPPMVYINASSSSDMVVRPGQHVGVDGRVYHPYLRDWFGMLERATIVGLLDSLQQVFAKEPPAVQRSDFQRFHNRPIAGGEPVRHHMPSPPQLPPKLSEDELMLALNDKVAAVKLTNAGKPPPKPPKPGDAYVDSLPPRSSSRNTSANGPPLPPLPHERAQTQYTTPPPQLSSYNGYPAPRTTSASIMVSPQPGNSQDRRSLGLPLPPMPRPMQQQQYQQNWTNHDRSPISPVSPVHGHAEFPQPMYSQQPYPEQQRPPGPSERYTSVPNPPQNQDGQQSQPYPSRNNQPGRFYQTQFAPQQQSVQSQKPQPPPDLLSDPFDVSLSSQSSNNAALPAPPIPPNPEKEHLLHALSTTLTHLAQMKLQQNLSALQPLQAQNTALQQAHNRLETEIRQLESLSATLDTNEAILRRSIQDCDDVIAKVKGMPQPAIDEVLVAPTMVANQLWTLCAEEAACREAMYVLQKALDRGRISGPDFVKGMRGLGRECFLKMALAKKCARGMGLEVE